MSEIETLGESLIALFKKYESLPDNNLKEACFEAAKQMINPIACLIEVEKFHKKISEKEYLKIKAKLGTEFKKFKSLSVNMKDEWNW